MIDQFDAAETGNLQWFIDQKAAGTLPDLMKHGGSLWTAPVTAAKHGHLDILKWMVLESGQHVDLSDDGNAVLDWAAARGNIAIIEWCISESGQPVCVNDSSCLALFWAAEAGQLEVVKWLLFDSGEKLKLAAEKFGFPDTSLPFDLGWDIDHDSDSALCRARDHGQFEIVAFLEQVIQLQETGLCFSEMKEIFEAHDARKRARKI